MGVIKNYTHIFYISGDYMQINLFSFNKKPNSTKRPTGNGDQYECVLLDECSVQTPTIKLKRPSDKTFINKNYAYIPSFNRYYYVTNVRFGLGVWYLDLMVDVLATARDIIGASTQYVNRSAYEFDTYIVDRAYPTTTELQYECAHDSTKTIFGDAVNLVPWFIVGIIGGMSEGSAHVIGNNVYDGSVVFYALTQSQMYELMLSLMRSVDMYQISVSEISQNLQKQLINPIQYIHSIKCIPFEPNYISDYSATGFYAGFNLMEINKLEEYTPPQ